MGRIEYSGEYSRGVRVLLHSVCDAKHLNGQSAFVIGRRAGLWEVRLCANDELVLVAPENIYEAHSPAARAAFLASRTLYEKPVLKPVLNWPLGHDRALVNTILAYLPPRETLVVVGDDDILGYCRRFGKWKRLDMNLPNGSNETVSKANSDLLFTGGRPCFDCDVRQVRLFDALAGGWRKLPQLRSRREGCAVARLDQFLVVMGGGIEEFEETTGMRFQLLGQINVLREEAGAVAMDLTPSPIVEQQVQKLECCSAIEKLDLSLGDDTVWHLVAVPNSPKDWALMAHAAVAIFPAIGCLGDQIILAGGGMGHGIPSARVVAYDPKLDAWTELPSMRKARMRCGCVVHPRYGLVVAGGLSAPRRPLATVEAYLPESGWRDLPPLDSPSSHVALALVDDSLYAVVSPGVEDDGLLGRWHSGKKSEIFQLTDGSEHWEILEDLTLPEGFRAIGAFGMPVACC